VSTFEAGAVSDELVLGPRRSRILVADDTESVRSLFRRLLTGDGHEVIIAADGAAALEAVHRHRPDVVLLDIAMPGMDGVKLAETIKQRYPDQRVMLMSAFVGLIHKMGYAGPPVAMLAKPFTPAELVKKVREVLRTH